MSEHGTTRPIPAELVPDLADALHRLGTPKADRCPGTGQRTDRHGIEPYEPDTCPVCHRVAYVRLDGTTGSHRR